jgi:2-keto-4-pentenoate hydratase/2-oxohepta-3-ene-1,7-dioic acid hydratase in catechol pathway
MLPVESQALPWVTLKPGDILCTGTPAKLNQKGDERKWLKPGDAFEMHVAEIGTLKNTVQDEKALAL